MSGQSRSQGLRQPYLITTLHSSQAEVSLIFSSDILLVTEHDFSEDNLKKHAWSTPLTAGFEAKRSSGKTLKPSVDVADMFQLGIDWDRKHKRTIVADEGCRVELKK